MADTLSIKLAGDISKAESFRRFSLQQLALLDNDMRFAELQQYRRIVQFLDGTVIECRNVFGTRTVSIYCVPGGGEAVRETEEIITTITLYWVVLIGRDHSYKIPYSVTEKEVASKGNPAAFSDGYEHHSDYFVLDEVNKDRTEECCVAVVGGVANIATDNIYVSAYSTSDDWHQKQFSWVGSPYNWAGTYTVMNYSDTWAHPGLQARSTGVYYCWSHSPATFGGYIHTHILRGIDQEKRVYRPAKIEYTNDAGKTVPVVLERRAYGKTPWTLNAYGKLESDDEYVTPSGVGDWVMNRSEDNWCMYLWPFVPYLWEIPGFAIFSWNVNYYLYGQCYIPETGTGSRQWSRHRRKADGTDESIVFSTDTAVFIGEPVTHLEVTAERPHIDWSSGLPVVVGDVNNTWVDSVVEFCDWSCALTKTSPIGTVCGGDVLSLENSITLSGSYAYSKMLTSTKNTTLGDGFYLWKPSYFGWWALGVYEDNSTDTQTEDYNYSISGTGTSQLKFGTTTIDSGESTYIYSAMANLTMSHVGNITIEVCKENLPWAPNDYTITSRGNRTDTFHVEARFTRNNVFFDVLDYDANSYFKVGKVYGKCLAVVYKKVVISHVIPRDINKAAYVDTGGAEMQQDLANCNAIPEGGTLAGADTTAATGKRTVSYILYCNFEGTIYTETLCAFYGSIGEGTGQRLYGVSVKVSDNTILVTYDLEDFVYTHGVDSFYDSPVNYEDWNFNSLGVALWSKASRCVLVRRTATNGTWLHSLSQFPVVSEDLYGVDIQEQDITNVEEREI